jgi:hypothetical protein
MKKAYKPVVDGLRERSVRSYFQYADQLVVSRQPAVVWPNAGNSFWITLLQGQWYTCTWSPVCYRVPKGVDLVAVCVEFVDRGESAQPVIPSDLVERFKLVELQEHEARQLFG